MADTADDRKSAARRKAEDYFTASARRDALVKEELEKERNKLASKMAKLKALRIAKEAAEKEAAANAPPRAKAGSAARSKITP